MKPGIGIRPVPLLLLVLGGAALWALFFWWLFS